MNIVLSPDSYKDSLSALKVSKIMNDAIQEIGLDEVIIKPMADGGEGTMETLIEAVNGTKIPFTCLGPLGESINTFYGEINDKTVVIECASFSGLMQVPHEKRNPDYTTTYGIGQSIIDALNRGYRSIIFGLGGSATNDGGLGLLSALGMKAYDRTGKEVSFFGRDLSLIEKVDIKGIDPRIWETSLHVACDVDNPLFGFQGASMIYGPQKGATDEQVKVYDRALSNYANLIEAELGRNYHNYPGAGAAGGLGFAMLVLGAKLESGAVLLGEAISLEEDIKKADLVITGEGKSDRQTLFGKAPAYVADVANRHGVPVLLLSGSLDDEKGELYNKFNSCFSIIDHPMSLEECIDQAESLLLKQTKRIIHLVHSFSSSS